MKKLKIAGCILTAVCFSGMAMAQVKPAHKPAVKAVDASGILPLDPAVRYGKLPNGFTYYIRHNETPKDRVLMYLVNKAGSILEDEDQRGLAHFMEHMSFNGTKHFPHNQLEDYLQKAGVRFGADLNAYTSFDETVYELPIPTDKPEVLNAGIQIMRDWAHDATLDPQEIDKERGVVLEEERLGKGAEERMRRVYFPVLLNHSRYAERVPIGVDAVLKNFKRPVIARFYNDWYRPNLQALIIVGDVDINAIEKQVKAKFGDLKNPANQRSREAYKVPLIGKNQFLALTDKEQTNTVAEIIFKRPQVKLQTAADLRVYVMRSLFNKMLNDRYSVRMTSANPPYMSCGGGISGFLGGLDAFDVNVTAKPGQLETGFKAAWEEIIRVKLYGFTQPELDRAKKSYIRGLETQLDEKDKTNSSSYVKEYQSHFLNNTASPGIEKEFELARNAVNDIALTELNALPAKYITTTNRDILIKAPATEKDKLPAEEAVNDWIKQAESNKIEPYQEKAGSSSLLAKTLQPGKIVDEKTNTEIGFTTLKLANGATVILKPTNFKNDEILFTSFARGGVSLYSDADYQSAANAVGLIMAGGAGTFDIIALKNFLSDKQLAVQPYMNELYQGVTGRTSNKDLTTALQLVDAYLTEPRKDQTMFNNIITQSTAIISNRGNDPKNVFQDSMLAVLFNNNFRKTGPSLEKLKQISLDRSYEIYRERLGDVSGMIFIFVGSFTVDQMKPLLEQYIGSLPGGKAAGNFENRHIEFAKGVIEKNVYKGSEPRATVSLIYSGTYTYDRVANMEIDALKEALQIRVLERLREEESGVYSPSVASSNSKYPSSSYLLQISFACSPQNVDRLVASAKDEVEKLKANGPAQVNVDKWKAQMINQVDAQLKENSFWLAYISGQIQNDMEMLPVASYKERMDKVTTASLKEAANKYLNGKNYIRVVLLPENK